MQRILLLINFLFLSGAPVIACSMPQLGPTRFDKTQTILIGEIAGYADSVALVPSVQNEAYRGALGKFADYTAGIVVSVKESFYSPEPIRKKYEVFLYGLAPNCEFYGLSVDQLKERYKIGQRVRIIAAKAKHVVPASDPETGRLERRFSSYDTIDALSDSDDRSSIKIGSEFNYRKYRSDLVGNPWFELIKDLQRLDAATTQDDRNRILDRLTYFPRFCENCTFFLHDVFETYTSNKDEFERFAELVQKRGMIDEEFQDFEKRRLVQLNHQ